MTDDMKAGVGTKNGAPSGFDIRVGREQGDGWLKKDPGTTVQGRLLGRFVMSGMKNDDGEARVFYQIQLTAGEVTANRMNDRKEKEEVKLGPGNILNVDEHKALEDLEPYTRDGGIYEVWFRYVKQEPLKSGGNRKVWIMSGPQLKPIKPPTRQVKPLDRTKNEETGDNDSDDIPF